MCCFRVVVLLPLSSHLWVVGGLLVVVVVLDPPWAGMDGIKMKGDATTTDHTRNQEPDPPPPPASLSLLHKLPNQLRLRQKRLTGWRKLTLYYTSIKFVLH